MTYQLPHNQQAEEATIGAVLINPEAYYDASWLQPEDFYIHRLRWVWQAYVRLTEKRTAIDLLTVTEELDRMGQLAEIGGPAFLTALVNQVPSSLNVEAYSKIVHENSLRRKLIQAASKVANLANDDGQDAEAIMDGAFGAIEEACHTREDRGLVSVKKLVSQAYDEINELSQNVGMPGVPTGLIDLDQLLCNMREDELLIIAGRPGMGKSGFLATVGNHASELGKHVAHFTLEMGAVQCTRRYLAQIGKIDIQSLKTGKLTEGEWPKFTHAVEVLEGRPIYIDDTPAIAPLQILTRCKRLAARWGLDLIIVDYLQLMTGVGDSRAQEVGYCSRFLKRIAKELHVPVLAAAQLNRQVEQRADKEPQLSDLKESGDIEQDADVVMFLHRPENAMTDLPIQTRILVKKQRDGAVGAVDTLFVGKHAKFESLARQQ